MGIARILGRKINQATGSLVPRLLLDHLLKENATVLHLDIDSDTKTIKAVIQIKDQPTPVKLTINDYRLEAVGPREVLRWSTIVIEEGAMDLPPGLKSKLEFVL